MWTWNAIGKAPGAWRLAPGANESRLGFLLNHLISEELPAVLPPPWGRAGERVAVLPPPWGRAGERVAVLPPPWGRAGERVRSLATLPLPPPKGGGKTAGERVASPTPTRHRTSRLVRRARAHLSRRCRRAGRDLAHLRGDARGAGHRGEAPVVARLLRRKGRTADDPARARDRPQRLRRLPRLRDELQGMEHLGRRGHAGRRATPTARPRPAPSSTGCRPSRWANIPTRETVHFPKSCLHCEDPPCVPVCPTGASYKRAEDGIVLVDYDKCIGCKYCSWACPYGARELDEHARSDEEVHALRRPHLRRGPARGRAQARLRDGLPDRARGCSATCTIPSPTSRRRSASATATR